MATIKSDEKCQTQNFKVEIVGLWSEVPNVVSVDLGSASMELNEATEGTDKHRVFVPANGGTFQDLTLVYHKSKVTKKIADWFKNQKTKKEPRDITLTLLKRNGKDEARRMTAEKCWPKSLDQGNTNSKDSSAQSITCTFKVGRVVFG
jgi:hypothetical protein